MDNLVYSKKRRSLFLVALSTIAMIWLLTNSAALSRNFFSLAEPREILHSGSNSKVAVVSFLAGNTEAEKEKADEDDNYFMAARLLTYQLLHAPQTRVDHSIPFIVAVTPDVTESKRARLRKDGAIVVPVETVHSDMFVNEPRWRDCWTKLRIFDPEVLPFEKVLYIDGDTVLTRPIDGVFDDLATTETAVMSLIDEVKSDEAPLPGHYLFAGKPEAWTYSHPYPPDMSGDYFNAGFFVYGPSHGLYEYYMSLLNSTGKFDPRLVEQNLLNYAHRPNGNMPWNKLQYSWNMNFPNMEDLKGGAASLHVKFWENGGEGPSELVSYAMRWKGEMEGYWIGVDATR